MPPENETPGECATCADNSPNKIASRANAIPNMIAYKPRGERGPTVYRDMTGIAPEHMDRLSAISLIGTVARANIPLEQSHDPIRHSASVSGSVLLGSAARELPRDVVLLGQVTPLLRPGAHLLTPGYDPPPYIEGPVQGEQWEYILRLLHRLYARWLGRASGDQSELGAWGAPVPQPMEDCEQSLRYGIRKPHHFRIVLWSRSGVVERWSDKLEEELTTQARQEVLTQIAKGSKEAIQSVIDKQGIPELEIELVVVPATAGFTCPPGCVLSRTLVAWNFEPIVVTGPFESVVHRNFTDPVTGVSGVEYVAMVYVQVSFVCDIIFDVFCKPMVGTI